MSIHVLSSSLSSQISSGEIIERPASVVKEIIENSIDAGAKNINIFIEKNGFQSILIQDDGYGIAKQDLLLAISHHATSKITTLSDLDSITTFGFRGEALASIRAVSRLTIVSSKKSSYHIAWKIYSEGFFDDHHISLTPIAHPLGTSVLVENLFFNMPNRLLFLKNTKIEFLNIIKVIKIIALSYFDINFSLQHNKKIILKFNAIKDKTTKVNRFQDIFNHVDINKLIEIQTKKNNIILFGWIFDSNNLKNIKNIQYCYINHRYTHNNIFISAVCAAYYKITGHKNISFVLYLNIASNHININIHPTKNTIKFHEPNKIYQLIYEIILHSLQQNQKKYLFKNIDNKHLFQIKQYKNNTLDSLKYLSLPRQTLFLKKTYLSHHIVYDTNHYLKKYYCSIGELLIIIHKYYGLIFNGNNFLLISFPIANAIISKEKLKNNIQKKITPKYISSHIQLNFAMQEYIILLKNREILSQIGFHLIFKKKCVILKFFPLFLKKKNIEYIILKFFKFLFIKKKISIVEAVNWFYTNVFIELKSWTCLKGISVILQMEYYCPLLLNHPSPKLLQKINIDKALCMLKI